MFLCIWTFLVRKNVLKLMTKHVFSCCLEILFSTLSLLCVFLILKQISWCRTSLFSTIWFLSTAAGVELPFVYYLVPKHSSQRGTSLCLLSIVEVFCITVRLGREMQSTGKDNVKACLNLISHISKIESIVLNTIDSFSFWSGYIKLSVILLLFKQDFFY